MESWRGFGYLFRLRRTSLVSVIGTRIDPHSRHSYENAPTPLSSAPLNPTIPRSRHSGPPIRHSREGGNPAGCGNDARTLPPTNDPIFIPWCAGIQRGGAGCGNDAPINLDAGSPPMRNVPNCRPVADGGMRKCARGLVPRWGRGGAWQSPPCQFAVPSHKSGFS